MSHRLAMSSASTLLKSYSFPIKNSEIKSKFLPKYRLPLIDYETSVEKLSLASFPSNNIYIKRDDQLDAYASGNKLRKLEFLFGEILSRPQCEHIITAGSLHSNHCKAVASLAARFQRKAHFLLRTDRTKDDEQLLQGNVLLNYLFGAKLYLIPKKANIQRDIEPRMNRLEEELGGKDRCYSIPIGGSDIIGIFGYLDCFIREIVPLIDKLNLGHLVLPMSSGGTMEGLSLGNYFTGNRLRIHAFAVSDNENYFQKHFHTILKQLELDHLIPLVDNKTLVDICDSYVGLGYGRMTDEQIDFLRQAIGETGILFDPVYTGKCLWGLHEELTNQHTNRFPNDGKNILVLHTGGAIGLMNPDYGKQWLLSNNTHPNSYIRDWMMSTSINKVFDNVPDCVGYLIMNEDGSVEHSHGDLQNNEPAANLLYKMVLCAAKVSVHPTKQLAFKRFTVSDDQYVYCIACANHRIYVAKRRQESSALA